MLLTLLTLLLLSAGGDKGEIEVVSMAEESWLVGWKMDAVSFSAALFEDGDLAK